MSFQVLRGPAITGREELGDVGTPQQALAQFYRAFNRRDLDLMGENWLQSEEAVMDNALGGVTRGWTNIRGVYQRIFWGGARVDVEFYDYTLHVSDALFFAVGRERGMAVASAATLELHVRTTRIFRKEESGWRQVHHHGSFEDPELLRAYQQAVR